MANRWPKLLQIGQIVAPVVLGSVLLSGCHCFQFSEKVGDLIDHVSDKELALDRFYREKWDLTRICRDCQTREHCRHIPLPYPDSRIPERTPHEPHSTPGIPAVPPPELNPIPAVPAAAHFPVLDTQNIREIDTEQPVSAVGQPHDRTAVAALLSTSETNSSRTHSQQTSEKLAESPNLVPELEPSVPLPEQILATPPTERRPISAPDSVPPSQKYHQSARPFPTSR